MSTRTKVKRRLRLPTWLVAIARVRAAAEGKSFDALVSELLTQAIARS